MISKDLDIKEIYTGTYEMVILHIKYTGEFNETLLLLSKAKFGLNTSLFTNLQELYYPIDGNQYNKFNRL
jgi:hypothetical protein